MFGIQDRFQRLNAFAHPLRVIGQLQQPLLLILRQTVDDVAADQQSAAGVVRLRNLNRNSFCGAFHFIIAFEVSDLWLPAARFFV